MCLSLSKEPSCFDCVLLLCRGCDPGCFLGILCGAFYFLVLVVTPRCMVTEGFSSPMHGALLYGSYTLLLLCPGTLDCLQTWADTDGFSVQAPVCETYGSSAGVLGHLGGEAVLYSASSMRSQWQIRGRLGFGFHFLAVNGLIFFACVF